MGQAPRSTPLIGQTKASVGIQVPMRSQQQLSYGTQTLPASHSQISVSTQTSPSGVSGDSFGPVLHVEEIDRLFEYELGSVRQDLAAILQEQQIANLQLRRLLAHTGGSISASPEQSNEHGG